MKIYDTFKSKSQLFPGNMTKAQRERLAKDTRQKKWKSTNKHSGLKETAGPQPAESVDVTREMRKVGAAVASLSHERADGYADWIGVLLALKGVTKELGEEVNDRCLEMWHDFSRRSDKYDEDETEYKWGSYAESDDDPLKMGTLIMWAREDDPEAYAQAMEFDIRNAGDEKEEPCDVVRPLSSALPTVIPFSYDLLPKSIVGFVSDIAERLQCPPDFAAVATIAVIGSVIGRRCSIRPQQRTDWTVVPNLWGGVVGRPSVLKTPAIRRAISMLQRMEAESKQIHAGAMADYEVKQQLVSLEKKQAELDAKKALKEGRRADALTALSVDTPKEPVRARYMTNDATVEKLGELLADNPAGILVFRDELIGWLYSLERENQQSARSFYLEAWDGIGRFTYDRIGRGTIDIESAVVSVFGGIQPAKLGPYVNTAVRGGAEDDGLIQRFQLLVWPDVPRDWKNVDTWPNANAKDRVYRIVQRLAEMDAVSVNAEVDKFDCAQIPFLRFDKDAQVEFDTWRVTLEHRLRSDTEYPALEAHLGKYRSLVPSLALIFHLAENEQGGPVGMSSLELALRWAEYLESHARRVYGAALCESLIIADAVWKRIRDGDLEGRFNARDVYRCCWSGLDDVASVKSGLQTLADHGYLMEIPQKATGGRPALVVYEVNPAAMEISHAR